MNSHYPPSKSLGLSLGKAPGPAGIVWGETIILLIYFFGLQKF